MKWIFTKNNFKTQISSILKLFKNRKVKALKNYDFELGYTINLPSELAGEPNLKNTNSFNVSIAYLLDWD